MTAACSCWQHDHSGFNVNTPPTVDRIRKQKPGFDSDGNARERRSRSFLYSGNVVPASIRTRSSTDADNRRDAFSGQSRSTNMVPFWVRCDFSLNMWPPPRVTRV